jgi:hypothetical protein
MKKNVEEWKKKYPKGKAFLSWDLADYLAHDLEPIPAVMEGTTEGATLGEDEIESYLREEIQCLAVFRENYPEKFDEQYRNYILDLEYLLSLGKISEDELDKLTEKGNFKFGQE